jgi:uncharacterized RDD family membrane protein YckC
MGQPGPGGQDPSTETSPTSPPAPSWQPGPGQSSTPGSGAPAWTANLTSTAPVAGPAGYFYADVPNRIIAYIIDFIILFVAFFVVALIINGIFGSNAGLVTIPTTTSILVSTVINFIIGAVYFIFTWTNPGMRGSPGMRVLGMQVGHQVDGRTLTINEALIRYGVLFGPYILIQLLGAFSLGLALILNLLGLVWFIVLLVTTAQSPTKQGLHDRYAQSVVVKAARAVA